MIVLILGIDDSLWEEDDPVEALERRLRLILHERGGDIATQPQS